MASIKQWHLQVTYVAKAGILERSDMGIKRGRRVSSKTKPRHWSALRRSFKIACESEFEHR